MGINSKVQAFISDLIHSVIQGLNELRHFSIFTTKPHIDVKFPFKTAQQGLLVKSGRHQSGISRIIQSSHTSLQTCILYSIGTYMHVCKELWEE